MSEEEILKKLENIKVSGDKGELYNFEAGIILNLIETQKKSIEILVAQKQQLGKDSDKWFETTVRQAEKFIKINDKKDKTIDKLIECLAEERGTDEDEIREVFGCE